MSINIFHLEQLMRSIEYIEKNLKSSFSINDVAEYTGYSLYHFIRIFNTYTGHSPYDYIMRRRLSQAALELNNSSCRITDLAFDYSFNNVETFSRAFRKMFGILPNQFRKDSPAKGIVLRNPMTYEYLSFINSEMNKIPGKMIMPEIKLLCTFSETQGKEIIPLCNKLKSLVSGTGNLEEEDTFYSLLLNPKNRLKSPSPKKLFNLPDMICIKVSSLDSIPDIAFGKIISSSQYACFICKAHRETQYAYEYIFQTWLPVSNLKHSEPFVLEHILFDRNDMNYSSSEILIPIE